MAFRKLKTIFAASMSHLKIIYAYYSSVIQKIAAFLRHYFEKLPHVYPIILKNYRMSIAYTSCNNLVILKGIVLQFWQRLIGL